MQTGEYRGFVGQFSVWLRNQVLTWRVPLLLSLALHVLLFWPQSLQEQGLAMPAGRVAVRVQARLSPLVPALPSASVQPQPAARHAAVTQSSSSPVSDIPAMPRDETILHAASGPVMQVTPGLDAAAVREYRIAWARALTGSALREQLGPDRQGVLEVGVALAASGQVRDIAVLRGSGDEVLDAAVVMAMRNAMSAVAAPAVMQGRALVLTVPVEVGAAPPISAAGR